MYVAQAEKTGRNVVPFAPLRSYSVNFSDTKLLRIGREYGRFLSARPHGDVHFRLAVQQERSPPEVASG